MPGCLCSWCRCPMFIPSKMQRPELSCFFAQFIGYLWFGCRTISNEPTEQPNPSWTRSLHPTRFRSGCRYWRICVRWRSYCWFWRRDANSFHKLNLLWVKNVKYLCYVEICYSSYDTINCRVEVQGFLVVQRQIFTCRACTTRMGFSRQFM